MKRTDAVRIPTLAAVCCYGALLTAAGCKKEDSPPAAAPGAPTAPSVGTPPTGHSTSPSDLVEAGKAVFAKNNCANCHAINGQGGRGAPDLSHVGSEEGHTAEWLVAHVRNPKAHKPNSRMPSFEGKISDQELLALGAYLASLK